VQPIRGRFSEEGRKVVIRFQPPPTDQPVFIDHLKYLTHESLEALLINAAHVTPEGGIITISLKQENNHAIITIKNSQGNMTSENFTIEEGEDANKMDLDFIQEYFEGMLGGTFKLRNEHGEGTMIEIILPLSEERIA
jgi:signal transduction histidine kinase